METNNQTPDHYQPNTADEANGIYARHGGVHFRNNATAQEINNYVRKLPAGKRESLFEVLDHLDQAGLITVLNDHVYMDGNGEIGGDRADRDRSDRDRSDRDQEEQR